MSQFYDPGLVNRIYDYTDDESDDNNNNNDNNDSDTEQSDEPFDINNYVFAEEEEEFNHYTDLINIFTVYYKTLFKKKADVTLFDGIDMQDDTSTNRALEMFYDEIYKLKNTVFDRYKTLYDPDEYKKLYSDTKIPDDYPLYSVCIQDNTTNETKLTHNLIIAISYIAEFDWIKCKWSINQLNTY